MAEARHAGFSGYLLRSRVDPGPPRPDGAVALVFDATMRVLLHPLAGGDLVLEARIAELAASRDEADASIAGALSIAAGRAPAAAEALVLDREERHLLLQQRVGADASADEFEAALGAFLGALSGWRAQFGST